MANQGDRVKEMILVSIIVPVYNVDKYIKECLESVRRQSLTNIEIICIDDGSTDNSLELLRSYAAIDSRIRILTQSNKGAGCARNVGLKEARGEYIAFLDADDYYIDSDALERMYTACKEHNVNVCGSLRRNLENGKIKDEWLFDNCIEGITVNRVYSYEAIQCDYGYQSFLFNREMLINNGIEFPLYRRFQDPPFFVKAMYVSGKFYLLDTYLYCYRVPDIRQRFDMVKTLDLLDALKENMVFAKERNLEQLFYKTLERLEYEFASIICHNISNHDLRIVRKLMEINDFICMCVKDSSYVIKPLRDMLSIVNDYSTNYEERLLAQIQNATGIFIYGAGVYGQGFLCWLERKGLKDKVNGFLVTVTADNHTDVNGITVRGIEDIALRKGERIFVAVGGKFQKEIITKLKEKKNTTYEVLDITFVCKILYENE